MLPGTRARCRCKTVHTHACWTSRCMLIRDSMSPADAYAAKAIQDLLNTAAKSKGGKRQLQANVRFNKMLTTGIASTVEIWHHTDDACGPLCDQQIAFLKEVAEVESKQGDGDQIHVKPHFTFQKCPYSSAARCATACTASGKCETRCINCNHTCRRSLPACTHL